MKVAILIDGGYFLKRLPSVRPDIPLNDSDLVDRAIGQLVRGHLEQLNKTACLGNLYALLYRCFYYDARPCMKKGHLPVSKRAIDYAKSEEATFRLGLFDRLRRRVIDSLTDADFSPGFRQKAVDMTMGVDIASITLKKQADTIVLVTGDSDFVPAAKLARREGVRIVLDPLWRNVESSLFEHIDALRSGFYKPSVKEAEKNVEVE